MPHTSRRKFAQSLAAASAMLPLAAALAQTSPEPAALAKALTELTRTQYGRFLDADDLVQIEKDFEEAVPSLERFRSFKLTNADGL